VAGEARLSKNETLDYGSVKDERLERLEGLDGYRT